MNIGNVFHWEPKDAPRHPYIVISHPSENDGCFIVVNITETVNGEYSFVLPKGVHEAVIKDSDVNFGDAIVTDDNEIQAEIAVGNATAPMKTPMDIATLREIISAARVHPLFSKKMRRMLPNL